MIIGTGVDVGYLDNREIRAIVESSLDSMDLIGKRVLILIPDSTRTMPMPFLFDLFEEFLCKKVKALDYLVALGTHQPLNDKRLSKLVGRQVVDGAVGNSCIYNHAWDRDDTFIRIGNIPASEMDQLTGGLIDKDVPVQVNKLIYNYDQVLICGPVFPHEVVGFSGGNKYFIPGIAGPEIINFTHWLGALITSYRVIGRPVTPVRAVIERAAEFIRIPTACFAMVVTQQGTEGIYFGLPQEAWQAAATLSAKRHIVYKQTSFKRVLSIMPEMYDDLWTAAKGMYKLEPVIADGGEVIIYAPHITEVSYTHGKLIDEIGYHCCDYFTKQWDKFQAYPGGVLAHSTHLKGLGTYDPISGIETPRIKVTLSTGIPEDRCNKLNLGYLDPRGIVVGEWKNREDDGIFVAFQAGETLYRLTEESKSM